MTRGLLLLALFTSPCVEALTIQESGHTYSWTFNPAFPAANQPTVLEFAITPPDRCYSAFIGVTVDVAKQTIEVRVDSDDVGYAPPCPANALPTRSIPISGFLPGTYAVEYVSCAGNAPPGAPPCNTFGNETLVVEGGATQAVPALSTYGLMALVLAISALAFNRRAY